MGAAPATGAGAGTALGRLPCYSPASPASAKTCSAWTSLCLTLDSKPVTISLTFKGWIAQSWVIHPLCILACIKLQVANR